MIVIAGRTDAQRRAQNKYDAGHYKVLTCKVQATTADAFRDAAAANGSTVNAVLTDFVNAYIKENSGE